MRTTIELPDALMERAKSQATVDGISLKRFFIEAVEHRLVPASKKTRRNPPLVSTGGPRIQDLTPQQIEHTLFGAGDGALSARR